MGRLKEYECMKDWTIESGTYFEKGKKYMGHVYNDGKSVKMIGELGMAVNFHEGSEYFKIDQKKDGEIYLFMNLNEVLGDTYYTDVEEVKKLVDEANAEYGGDFWYKTVTPNR